METVSVIVPVYNGREFIVRCLSSIFNQNCPELSIEIVVVDDGSTDGVGDILDSYGDRLVVVSHEANRGLPASLNSGILKASGEYIFRIDADDYVNANAILILHSFLEFNKIYGAVCCDYFCVDRDGNFIERHDAEADPIGCGILFRTQALKDIGLYNEKFLWHEDKELHSRFSVIYPIGHVKIPLYRYRRHDNNITNNTAMMSRYQKLLVSEGKNGG